MDLYLAILLQQWADAHPWLTFWLALCLLFCVAQAITNVLSTVGWSVKLAWRVLRCINVLCRGWPPLHLDADGDWKPEPKETEEAKSHD